MGLECAQEKQIQTGHFVVQTAGQRNSKSSLLVFIQLHCGWGGVMEGEDVSIKSAEDRNPSFQWESFNYFQESPNQIVCCGILKTTSSCNNIA